MLLITFSFFKIVNSFHKTLFVLSCLFSESKSYPYSNFIVKKKLTWITFCASFWQISWRPCNLICYSLPRVFAASASSFATHFHRLCWLIDACSILSYCCKYKSPQMEMLFSFHWSFTFLSTSRTDCVNLPIILINSCLPLRRPQRFDSRFWH